MEKHWEDLVRFLKEYDIKKVIGTIQQTNWNALAHEPLFWIFAVALLGWVLWRKAFRLLLVVLSVAALVLLVQYTMPQPGQAISLDKLLPFAGGCVLLVAINVYFLIIRN